MKVKIMLLVLLCQAVPVLAGAPSLSSIELREQWRVSQNGPTLCIDGRAQMQSGGLTTDYWYMWSRNSQDLDIESSHKEYDPLDDGDYESICLDLWPDCGSTYYAKGFAQNSDGIFESNVVSFTTDPCVVPGSFSVTADGAVCHRDGNSNTPAVRLGWNSAADADNYTVYRDGIAIASNVDLAGNSYFDYSGLLIGNTHEYYAEAHNGVGTTISDNSAFALVPLDVCDDPSFPPLRTGGGDGSSYGGSGNGSNDQGGDGGSNPPLPPVSLFFDDFEDNALDSLMWSKSGKKVKEEEGEMRVLVTQSDNGGELSSASITIDPATALTLTRRVRVYSDNTYGDHFDGHLEFEFVGFPEYGFGVSYAHHEQTNSNNVDAYGTGLFRNDARTHRASDQGDVSARVSSIWGTWYDERLVFDPTTGILEYYRDDILEISYDVGILPVGAVDLNLHFDVSGWNTGHYQHMEFINISQ